VAEFEAQEAAAGLQNAISFEESLSRFYYKWLISVYHNPLKINLT